MSKEERKAKVHIIDLFRKSQVEIAELKARNENIRIEERKKLGAQLHDGFAGALAAVKIQLEVEIYDVEDAALRNKLLSITKQVKEIYETARNKSHHLYKGIDSLSKKKFSESIVKLIENILPDILYKKRIAIDNDALKNVTHRTKQALFYIVQEAATNIFKHAEADTVTIQLYKKDTAITLKVIDNGKGFNENLKNQIIGIGLESIKNRIADIKASLDIISTQRGTELSIIVPGKTFLEKRAELFLEDGTTV